MSNLNEVAIMKFGNCIIHVCDNAIVEKEEEEEILQFISNIAYEGSRKEMVADDTRREDY